MRGQTKNISKKFEFLNEYKIIGYNCRYDSVITEFDK